MMLGTIKGEEFHIAEDGTGPWWVPASKHVNDEYASTHEARTTENENFSVIIFAL
jgi:hypothetical protein